MYTMNFKYPRYMGITAKQQKTRLARNQRIVAWGTGAGIRLSKDLMAQSGLNLDQEVELVSVPEGILVRPARPVYDINELVSRMTDENRPEFVEFGPAVGKEIIDG